MPAVYAQAPVITADQGPIKLYLDAGGKYTVQLQDIATVRGITNPVKQTLLSPAMLDCSLTGAQVITVTATNGVFATPTNPAAVTFGGPWNITIDNNGNIYFSDFGNNKIKKIDQSGLVTTLAGSGNKACNDGPASTASFSYPIGLVADQQGNIYVADALCNEIKKITPAGDVSIFAGTGSPGYVDGTGTSAAFNTPLGLTMDGSGNLYVADEVNQVIRKITPVGLVTTFAGNGALGSTDGTAALASFYNPSGVVVDGAGNVYVTDNGNNKIRKISPAGLVNTLAGNGTAGSADGPGPLAEFDGPYGIAINSSGNLYVGERFNNEIRKITAAGVVTTFAGNTNNGTIGGSNDGIGTAASFSDPTGIAIDAAGDLFVADRYNHKIRKITPAGVVTTFAGSGNTGDINGNIGGTPASGMLSTLGINVLVFTKPTITSVLKDQSVSANADCTGKLSDYTQGVTATDNCPGSKITFSQSPAAGTPVTADTPVKVTITATDATGATDAASFIAAVEDKPNITANQGPIVFSLDATGNYQVKLSDVATVSSCDGSAPTVVLSPSSFNCTSVGAQTVIVTAYGSGGTSTISSLNFPYGVVTDAAGNIYLADAGDNQVKKITPSGVVTIVAGTGAIGATDGPAGSASFNRPTAITMDAAGNLYITDPGNFKIREITTSGNVITIAGTGVSGGADGSGNKATFNNPTGIAIDAAGNLYIVDAANNKIRKITTYGTVSTFAGSGQLSSIDGTGSSAGFYNPHGIAIDKAGNFFIADGNNRIRKITPDAVVTTLAGTNSGNTDGTGPAASFYYPNAIAIDASGNLYITDTGNNEIRKMNQGGVVTTIAGNGSIGSIDGNGKHAVFNAPTGIAIDAAGNLYVTDSPDNKIRKITINGDVTTLTTITTTNGTSSSLPVKVLVQSSPTITSTYNGTTVAAYGSCIPVLPDYTLTATASDVCKESAITFTQSPAAGTPMTIGVQTSVSLTATDATGATTNIIFNVTAINATGSMVSFNGDVSIPQGGKVKLMPNVAKDIVSYSWSPTTGLSDPAIANPYASPAATTIYKLHVISAAGCEADAELTVTVTKQILIPGAFTPNGDGINDFWDLTYLDQYPSCSVDIYNRYGQSVYHSIGYARPWNGTYGSSKLPVGVYYYVIDLKNGKPKIAGQVTILR